MLTLEMPTLLALLGTGLMAIVIFAPQRAPEPRTTVSFAPPPSPPVDRLTAVDVAPDRWASVDPVFDRWSAAASSAGVTWPSLIDPRAVGCDVAGRRALADALGTVGGAWAAGIVRRALAEETDAGVRDALGAALARWG
ncbi:MAG: hypothetical protein JOZ86_11350 [Candidatus Eremiobacteraeota bacterium]|nr:hypothetical protein [Candidatus Eremiobacteraeota bacterium]